MAVSGAPVDHSARISTLPVASIRLPAHPTSSRAARRFVTRALTAWGCEAAVEDASLLVSELVTNAIVHARTPVDLIVRHSRRSIRVEVYDDGDGVPEPRFAPPDAPDGRGLGLVQVVAMRWGVEDRPPGKSVWFEVDSG